MSKLGNTEPTHATSALTDEAIVEYLKACQAILVEHAADRFVDFSKALEHHFQEHSARAKTNKELAEAQEQHELMHQSLPEIERYFLGYLGEGFIKFRRQELTVKSAEEKFSKEGLSLVNNEDLEESIAITSITHRAENIYAESLWALNQRLTVLNKDQPVEDRNNPAGPVQCCESLRKSLQRTALLTKNKIITYKLFEREVMTHLGAALDAINQYLSRQGVHPKLRHRPADTAKSTDAGASANAAGGSVKGQLEQSIDTPMEGFAEHPAARATNHPEHADAEVAANSSRVTNHSPDHSQVSLVSAIRSLQHHLGGLAQTQPVAYLGETPSGPAQWGTTHAHTGLMNEAHDNPNQPQLPTDWAATGVPVQNFAAARGFAAQPEMPAGAVAVSSGRPPVVFTSQQLVEILQSLQTQALTAQPLQVGTADSLSPQQVGDVNQLLVQQLLQEEGDENALDPEDMHTIDLVGMLFEYMLSDDNLPDSVKALLSYLHTPYLKVAFLDKDFFGQADHPARLLLNNMAEAGVKWVSNDGSSQYEIYDKIKAIVARVLEDFTNDVRLFAELLLEFSGYTKKIARRQELMERRAMEKVQGEEKLREVKIRVNEEVCSRTDGRELPSAVLLLLLQPWSDFLAFTLLRYGEDSDSWINATQVIDDVLWSIEPHKHSKDHEQQPERYDALLNSLESGFETIGYDLVKGKKLLEALYSLQKMAQQSKPVVPAPEELRSKLEAQAALKVNPSGVAEEPPTETEQEIVDYLRKIEFGTWFEFKGGKRLKVAWYNAKTLQYMLVDQMGKKVAMKSGRELARDILAQRTTVVSGSAKPLFDRALENIFNTLSAKAEEQPPT